MEGRVLYINRSYQPVLEASQKRGSYSNMLLDKLGSLKGLNIDACVLETCAFEPR